ncbi:hypothetical protein BWI97_25205 [Siphonobacter sp. BAB-5405]|uniref:hypothetical protein n=1 Tax=Siphonobacter sp. BAB-5405 TaxID=1864825 RepID=UPI000C806F70|nr:hypothetical protein [Siphonobacter sp. BAB-5405]PMD88615.1 hypothetical protein BWI97_25205 [Siphonobacter sp. BAB-5405]
MILISENYHRQETTVSHCRSTILFRSCRHALTNQITWLYGMASSIIQAPMLGVTTLAMVAGVSNAGGLGSLPVGGYRLN